MWFRMRVILEIQRKTPNVDIYSNFEVLEIMQNLSYYGNFYKFIDFESLVNSEKFGLFAVSLGLGLCSIGDFVKYKFICSQILFLKIGLFPGTQSPFYYSENSGKPEEVWKSKIRMN